MSTKTFGRLVLKVYEAEQLPVSAAASCSMQVFERSSALSTLSCTRAVQVPSSTCTNKAATCCIGLET